MLPGEPGAPGSPGSPLGPVKPEQKRISYLLRSRDEVYVSTLSIHYIQMEQNYGKNAYCTSFFVCVQMGIYLIFLQLLLFCEESLLERYAVWQLTMPSCSVVEQNFLNTNVIVISNLVHPFFCLVYTTIEKATTQYRIMVSESFGFTGPYVC